MDIDQEILLDHLQDALCQGGDTREVDGEYQVGHMFLSTWQAIHRLLICAGRLEMVEGSEYWARAKK